MTIRSDVERWIRLAREGAPGLRTFKRGLVQNVAYLIAHESHNRGNILLTLEQGGSRRAHDSLRDLGRGSHLKTKRLPTAA